MSPFLIFQIEGFNFWQCSMIAFFSSAAAFKTVENCKELLLILKRYHIVFYLSSVLNDFTFLLKFTDKKCSFHFLFLVFFELKSL